MGEVGEAGVPVVGKPCEEPTEGSAPTWEKWVRSTGLLWEGEARAACSSGECFLVLEQRVGLAAGDPAGFQEPSKPQETKFWRSHGAARVQAPQPGD